MTRAVNPGNFDHVLTFYAPTQSKDSIGATISTLAAQTPTLRGERVWRSSSEREEARQQVGATVQDFRVYDRILTITQQWEFDVYQISAPSVIDRYKVSGLQKEGRGNTILITAEKKDNN